MTEITQIHYMTQEESQLRRKCTTEETKTLPKNTLLHDFMSQWPTFNIATIMTAIMIPASGYHNTTRVVWTQPYPYTYTYTYTPQISKSLDLSEFSIKSHISLII
jgi:hypothetical protein